MKSEEKSIKAISAQAHGEAADNRLLRQKLREKDELISDHERSKDCIVLNFRLLINQNAKKWHCRHSHFSQMQNVHLPFSMLHHAPGYGIIGTRSSDQKPLR